MHEHDESILSSIGVNEDIAYGAVMPPLYLTTNFSAEGFGRNRPYDYSRSGNPTRDLLGEAIARLERGAGAVVTSSGMAAIDLVLSFLNPGELVVAPLDCYGGTWRLLTARARKGQIRVLFVPQDDAGALADALGNHRPHLVLVETPSNPLMRVVDIAAVAQISKAVGARVAVDNTFLSPVLQKPLTLGADFVIHSTTKYLNGHSDVVGGAVVAADAADAKEIAWWANCTGVTGSPFDAWLTLRGLRTLSVRMERQQASAMVIAAKLTEHPAVRVVHYPGLERHPSHWIAKSQQSGFGAMLSFELSGGAEAVPQFLQHLTRFTLAESLGGVESLIAHPATMTHAAMTKEAQKAAGIGDDLLRLSIGLEHAVDLWNDLRSALDIASADACDSANFRIRSDDGP